MIEALFLTVAVSIASTANPVPVVDSSYCKPEREIANRAWSLFIAKNPVNSQQVLNYGARIQALGSLLAPCGKEIKLSTNPLTKIELEEFEKFEPKSVSSTWAQCLSKAANLEALVFLQASDSIAYSNYSKNQKVGGFDDSTFQQLASTAGCKKSFKPNINATVFYSDLNWYVRVRPEMKTIIAWHRSNSNA